MARKKKNVSAVSSVPIKTISFRSISLRQALIGIGLGLGAFILMLVACYLYVYFMFIIPGKILPRTSIVSVSVGGLSADQAKHKVEQALTSYEEKEITVTGNDQKTWKKKTKDLDLAVPVDKLIGQAKQFGRDGTWFDQTLDIYQSIGLANQIVSPNDPVKLQEFIDLIAKEVDMPGRNAGLEIKGTTITEVAEQNGSVIDKEALRMGLRTRLNRLRTEPVALSIITDTPKVYPEGVAQAKADVQTMLETKIHLSSDNFGKDIETKEIGSWIIFEPSKTRVPQGRGYYLTAKPDTEKIKKYISSIASSIDQPAVDAKLTIKDGKVAITVDSKTGKVVKKDELAATIANTITEGATRTIQVPLETKEPEVSAAKLADLGINELIGTATTTFVRSPENRIHNINVGAGFLNGKLVKPGEEFSTIKSLGAIDETSGYLPELVIKDDKTQPEFGGGLCQVSTTLFRAVLNAGLPVTERQNHSWRISYYEPPVGLDATIYFPKPDFKFKNDSPGWILIQNKVEGTKITFELYGSKDGRRSEIIGPELLSTTPPPADVYADDPNMTEGEIKQIEKPHPGGRTTATYKVYDKDGKVINEQKFNSIYKAVPAKFLKGTKPKEG